MQTTATQEITTTTVAVNNFPEEMFAPVLSEKQKARFWSRVDRKGPDECWDWMAGANDSGYGQIRFKLMPALYAHRLSHFFHRGPFQNKLFVCHKCDRPRCVAPHHLFAATQKRNMEDCMAKGRFLVGEKGGSSVLTNAQAIHIHSLRLTGNPQKLAEQFSVSQNTIYEIWRGYSWHHVTKETNAEKRPAAVSKGTARYNAKLTEEDAYQIRFNSDGQSGDFLAKKYGVWPSGISKIRRGESWKHVSRREEAS